MLGEIVGATTSSGQAPGPVSVGTHPRLYVERVLAGVSTDVLRKIMHDTAATLYGLK